MLPKEIDCPSARLLDVLARRRSRTGGTVSSNSLASLLWHTCQLRERRSDGRFGRWESRPCPSAGGIHAIRLLVLPLETMGDVGVYDDDVHALRLAAKAPDQAIALNAASVLNLTGAKLGVTLQFVADPSRLSDCYDNHETLLWRDAGAFSAMICLVAEALGMSSVTLGRHGTDIVRSFGIDAPLVGVGGVHLGCRDQPA